MYNILETAQNKFIEGVGRISEILGINRFVAQLYALLYLSQKPMSLDEIAHALGASKGNVSINIRELEKWGAVRNIWIKGSRKDFYQVEPNIKKVFLNNTKSAIQKRAGELTILLEEFNQVLESVDGHLGKEEAKTVDACKRSLKEIEGMKNMLNSAIDLFSKFA